MKKFFARFAMSSRRRNASDRIEIQRTAGRKIQKRIEFLIGKDQSTLPRDAWVSNEELDSWRTSGRQLIEELFGADSPESRRWDELWEAEPPRSAFDKHPEDRYLNRLSQLQDYLQELKASPALSRNAIERVRDRIARHPLLGVTIAAAGVVARFSELSEAWFGFSQFYSAKDDSSA